MGFCRSSCEMGETIMPAGMAAGVFPKRGNGSCPPLRLTPHVRSVAPHPSSRSPYPIAFHDNLCSRSLHVSGAMDYCFFFFLFISRRYEATGNPLDSFAGSGAFTVQAYLKDAGNAYQCDPIKF